MFIFQVLYIVLTSGMFQFQCVSHFAQVNPIVEHFFLQRKTLVCCRVFCYKTKNTPDYRSERRNSRTTESEESVLGFKESKVCSDKGVYRIVFRSFFD